MQQLIGFFVSVFLFAGVFVSSVVSLGEQQNYRILKQNLNLLGREVINHIEKDPELGLRIDEAAFFQQIKARNPSGEIAGCIFSYKNSINVLKTDGGNLTWRIGSKDMDERNKINTINNMMLFLLQDVSKRLEINIASEDTNDYLTEELFNKLGENTVFIVCTQDNKVFLSGFILE